MIATGKAQWAKVLPHQLVTNDNYKDFNFWSLDLIAEHFPSLPNR